MRAHNICFILAIGKIIFELPVSSLPPLIWSSDPHATERAWHVSDEVKFVGKHVVNKVKQVAMEGGFSACIACGIMKAKLNQA